MLHCCCIIIYFIMWSTRGWKILLVQLLCSQYYHFQRMQIGPCFQGRNFAPPVLIFGERRCWIFPACCRVGQTISWTYPKHSTQLLKAKKLEPKVFVQFFLEEHGIAVLPASLACHSLVKSLCSPIW